MNEAGRGVAWFGFTGMIEPDGVGRIVFVNLGGEIVLDEAYEGIEVFSMDELPPGTRFFSVEELYALLGAALKAIQDDEMELPEPKIRAHYPQALSLLTGFDHAPRLATAAPVAEAERSPGIPRTSRFRSTTPGLAGLSTQRPGAVRLVLDDDGRLLGAISRRRLVARLAEVATPTG